MSSMASEYGIGRAHSSECSAHNYSKLQSTTLTNWRRKLAGHGKFRCNKALVRWFYQSSVIVVMKDVAGAGGVIARMHRIGKDAD